MFSKLLSVVSMTIVKIHGQILCIEYHTHLVFHRENTLGEKGKCTAKIVKTYKYQLKKTLCHHFLLQIGLHIESKSTINKSIKNVHNSTINTLSTEGVKGKNPKLNCNNHFQAVSPSCCSLHLLIKGLHLMEQYILKKKIQASAKQSVHLKQNKNLTSTMDG